MKFPGPKVIPMVFLLLACVATAAEDAAPSAPELHWKSRNEEGVYGYIVYRAEERSGPFLRVNSRIIPRHAQAPGAADQEYHFIDESALPDRPYYYFIDAIGDSGRRQRLTAILLRKAPVTIPSNP